VGVQRQVSATFVGVDAALARLRIEPMAWSVAGCSPLASPWPLSVSGLPLPILEEGT